MRVKVKMADGRIEEGECTSVINAPPCDAIKKQFDLE